MEEKQFLEILVKRYINNNLRQDEMEAFFHLLKQGKLDEILERNLRDEKYDQVPKVIKHKPRHFSGLTSNTFKIAAGLLMIIGIGVFALLNRFALSEFVYESSLVSVSTGKNQKKKIKLSDGSLLWLNESTSVKYPASFEPDARKVILVEGEVYFDIKRDEKRPFLVSAAGTTTKVLGTAFNIRSYSHLQNVQVTVTRGKVAVEKSVCNDTRKITKVLLPNEQVSVDLKTREIKKVAVNSANSVAWTAGKLLFDNESLGNILAVIENKFDVHVSLSDESVREYRASAEFVYSDSLDHILELLTMANSLNYKIEDNKVTISKKRKSVNNMPM
ncbi:hypothetical protein DSL64_06870 [Dyadobacter luteus]|jgi:transmembrane sensor|uniref:Iron dicitrate transport regulator FecR n=1 Tax=Dyadobacter luteus TaxID=2259619 RepID=A0A3D8YDS5_9BACT|nr:FecR domain-containing protein [Dyadobacter luteus]REA62642.1 hypothetical protein DSL64_06870 [Dyadobacter luteus]